MQLTPFDPATASTVSSWARSAEEVQAWCSRSAVPVPADVIASWGSQPDVEAFALVDEGELVGYGELWVDEDEAEVELARLIIEPGHRGSGYGRRLVTELVARAQQQHPAVIMRVHPDNIAAIRSYRAAGFAPIPAAEQAEWNVGQPMAYTWMTYRGR